MDTSNKMLLNEQEIKEIHSFPWERTVDFARRIESAVLEKLKAQEPYEIEYPEYHQQGMGCGLEDRDITDRYEAMAYGWDCAIDAMAECIPDKLYTYPLPPADVVRDAERYRWLVDNSYDRDGFLQFQVWKHSWEPHSQTGVPIEWKCRVRGPAIDAAIDAAMKEMK